MMNTTTAINFNEKENNYQTDKKKIEVDQVGFSTLPEQVHRKSLKKGFEFTLLVVGDSGLGKSTLVNSLFMTDLYAERVLDNVTDRISKTISITSRTAELEEKGVRLKLTVVDTPGFGDSINAKDSWKTIADYMDEQFNIYYMHESGCGLERKKLQDTRVHCCLYFIPPYVRGLRPIDVETMKCLQSRVNIVPVIAKADSLTKKELDTLKQNVLSDIEKYNLKIYEFPACDSDDDESFKKLDEEIKNAIPFGIIGSNTVLESGNKRVRGRVYPWGIVDIESNCCDFTKLRTFLCSSHMQDLKDLTHDVHYENYRTELIKNKKPVDKSNQNGIYMSSEEADKLLQQKDLELRKMQELITKMKINLNNSNSVNFSTTNNNTNNNSNSNNNPIYASVNHQNSSNAATTNLTSFGRTSNNPSFPTSSNYSLVNRNIPAFNAHSHNSHGNNNASNGHHTPIHNHHHNNNSQYHHHHHHSNVNDLLLQNRLLNSNNFINSTPI